MGIYRVQLAAIDTVTNGSSDGYQDYSCLRRANLLQGVTYTLRVQTGTTAAENVVAWIDYNNDGNFTASERVLYSLNAFTHAASFTVPTTATLSQPLRLRIAADYANGITPTACSTPQYSQTEDYQVRIAVGSALPVANFRTPDSVTCTGAVTFHDLSRNTPTAWRWQFGDGSTSMQASPIHTYGAAGTYTVKLRVCNAWGCDSLARAADVTVRTDGPKTINCQPATIAYCCNFGLTRIRLANLDHASADGQAGYEDFSCAYRAMLTADQPYILQLTTGPNAHDVRVYLDLNNDGQFSSASELLYQGLAVQSPTVPLTIASTGTTVYHQALRLRIVADHAGSSATGSCSPVLSGQAEDYSMVLLPNIAKPAAAFSGHYDQFCGPVKVSFTNATTGGATRYHWDFGDGSSSSQAAPPIHTYATAGVYEAWLVAQNAFGSDTARQRIAVATACPTYCPASGLGGSDDHPAYFTRVQFGEIDNTTYRGPKVGYRDFTAYYTPVQAGQTYAFRAESLPWSFANAGPWAAVELWLDANQDGQFTLAERMGPVSQFSPHLLSVPIPTNAKAGATRLRAIIHQENYYSFSMREPTPCPPNYLPGSVEDYTVVVLTPRVAPKADFLADQLASYTSLVQFRDTSEMTPTTWQWDFGDGTTSPLSHPLHQYVATGTYTVSLRAGNTYGSQTIIKRNYITVTSLTAGPRPTSCFPPFGPNIVTYGHWEWKMMRTSAWSYTNPHRLAAWQDETCTAGTLPLVAGATTAFLIINADTNVLRPSQAQIWLDANDDGVLDNATERIGFLPLLGYGPTWTIPLQVPSSALLHRPLRLRLSLQSYQATEGLPCVRQDQVGQIRDFTAVVTNSLPTRPGTTNAGSWQLVPNPSTGLVVLTGRFTAPTPITVYDVVGRCVYQVTATPTKQATLALDVQHLPHGVYYVRLVPTGQVARLVLE